MRWSISYFGVKDLFTLINLMGGVMGIYLALDGNLEWAGYAILAGYLFGDTLDGLVARATGTGNRFGSEFDSAAEGVSQGLAPAVVVLAAYRAEGQTGLGVGLMAILIATASIRQARFAVARFDYPLCYCGLPRTVSGLIAISFPNSTLFFHDSSLAPASGIVVIGLMAVLNLVPVPYMTHKGRALQGYVRLLVVLFLVTPFLMFFLARPFTFDLLFVYTFGYALGAWIPIRVDERRAYWAEYKRWAGEVATLR